MSEFVTWEALGGYAGAVMMVTLITQFLKGTPLGKWSSQLVAYVIAVVLLIGAEIFGGQSDDRRNCHVWRTAGDGAGGDPVPAECGHCGAGGQRDVRCCRQRQKDGKLSA